MPTTNQTKSVYCVSGHHDNGNVFSRFLRKKFNEHYVTASGGTVLDAHTYQKADEYRQQIVEQQKSVESCLSSASSSLCTNFTDDSGSFMVFFDVKVPLDYVCKSEVPFEPRNENHMKAEVVKQRDEYFGPYFVVPHSGQRIAMRELCVPEDRFYTQQTRARAGLRERLKVNVEPIERQSIGGTGKKFKTRFG